VTNAQDSNDLLAVVPAQLAYELDTRNQVHSAAGPEERPSRWTKKRAIPTASASAILSGDDTRRQRLGTIKIKKGSRA
jgi:hypothetical protein